MVADTARQGLDSTLTLKNGEQYTGIFAGASLESSKNHYTLKMVKKTRHPSDQQMNGNTEMPDGYTGDGEDHVMSFDVQDTVDLSVSDVSTAVAQPVQNGTPATCLGSSVFVLLTFDPGSINPSSFRTDTEISNRQQIQERELQRWAPDDHTDIDLSLESSGDSAGWDQFAVNERKYGVQSTYDENLYTTAIDRSAPTYNRKAAEAERLAREIEGRGDRDEEKEDGRGEEEKYSGVRRDLPQLSKGGAGSYVPPSRRPITGQPTVPGAPYDPAIISTARPAPAPAQETTLAEDAAPVAPVKESQAVPESDVPQADPVSSESKTPEAKDGRPPIPAVRVPKPEQPTLDLTRKTGDPARDVADAFKQFANMEKLKTKDRTQKLQEDRRTQVRHEKNVKLNDLKKFAANFKLKSRVPDDLVPILAKDREKQMEIQQKAEQEAREAELRQKEKEKETVAASPTPSQGAAPNMQFQQHSRGRMSQNVRQPLIPGQSPRGPLSQRIQQNQAMFNQGRIAPLPADLRIPTGPSSTLPADSGPLSPTSAIRLNVKAMEFKPNPGASTFTPGGASPSPTPDEVAAAPSPSFFAGKKPRAEAEKRSFGEAFNPVKRMLTEASEEQKKGLYAANGGIPQAYRTLPTWSVPEARIEVSYLDAFPKSQVQSHSASPLHTPIPTGPMQHQLPPHMQNGVVTPQIHTPSHTPGRYYPQPPQHPHSQGSFDGRPNWPQPGSSVQSSPRFAPPPMAFNGQMPQMPYGQPMPQQFGMSPGLPYRQLPGGPPFMNVPPQQMGGHMMVQQPSGGYANGPMPQGFNGSPRPHPMSHQGSHQGHQPQYMMPPQGPQMMPQPQMSPMPGYAQPHFQGHMPQQGQSKCHLDHLRCFR